MTWNGAARAEKPVGWRQGWHDARSYLVLRSARWPAGAWIAEAPQDVLDFIDGVWAYQEDVWEPDEGPASFARGDRRSAS